MRAPTHANITEFQNFLLQLEKQRFVWLLYYFKSERNFVVLKSKSPCVLLNKSIRFNKNEMESKMENPTHGFRETNFVLQLI